MLFRKDIPVSCAYCRHSAGTEVENTVLCSKCGVTPPKDKCRRFRYDPLKRIPKKAKAQDFSKFDEAEFTL